MGHVDHGKSTLIDFIRKTNTTEKEAGGITQAIGAYEIEHDKNKITFIDTPGHEAFNNMREHGAKVADLAILVVAADDGVKPQTKEALNCILQAGIPYVVAINKIDKDTANVEKTKSDLAQNSVLLEGFGGTVSWQGVSATTGEGVGELLDLIILATDLEELTYEPDAETTGIVLTSHRDPKRGITAGVVIQNGTLKRGAYIATPTTKGKIKILEDFHGTTQTELTPSAPALVLGFETLPRVGETFTAGSDKKAVQAKTAPDKQEVKTQKESKIKHPIHLILKANESGSLEALRGIIEKLKKTEEGKMLNIVEAHVGNITEDNIQNAVSTESIILGFNTKIDQAATNLTQARKVKVIEADIIYKLEEDLKEYMEKRAKINAHVIEILAVFGERKGKEQIVGGKVVKGTIQNKSSFEIWADEKQIGTGTIKNLQSGREDAEAVEEGSEMGALVESSDPIAVGHKLVFMQ